MSIRPTVEHPSGNSCCPTKIILNNENDVILSLLNLKIIFVNILEEASNLAINFTCLNDKEGLVYMLTINLTW